MWERETSENWFFIHDTYTVVCIRRRPPNAMAIAFRITRRGINAVLRDS